MTAKNINLPIKNQQLLDEALTHRSFLNENRNVPKHNERLEFLGDAVLELAVSEFLYAKYEDRPEGDLTAFRAALVKTTTLAQTAEKLKLGEALKLSKGEEMSGGRTNQSLLANTFESVIGAIYLDQGFDAVIPFLEAHLFPLINEIVENNLFKDFKSTLQEVVQAKGFSSPQYQVIKEVGPDHDKIFTISAIINDTNTAIGTGKSKQLAQQDAARAALEKLEDN